MMSSTQVMVLLLQISVLLSVASLAAAGYYGSYYSGALQGGHAGYGAIPAVAYAAVPSYKDIDYYVSHYIPYSLTTKIQKKKK